MRALTQNQINLLPEVKSKAPDNKKGEILKRLIDGYLGGEKLQKGDLDIIKIAVQLYQTNEKRKRLQAQQRQKSHKEIKAENAKKTREKIILGAFEAVAFQNDGYPFLNFLLGVWHGHISDTDLKFMEERYVFQQGKFNDGFKYLAISASAKASEKVYCVLDVYDPQYRKIKFEYHVYLYEAGYKKLIKSMVIKQYDSDPRYNNNGY